MKLDFSIGLGQRQGLTLTAQVQQAIKLLQMTNLEVNEYIEENFAINPFVELKDRFLRILRLLLLRLRLETRQQQNHLRTLLLDQKNQKPKLK